MVENLLFIENALLKPAETAHQRSQMTLLRRVRDGSPKGRLTMSLFEKRAPYEKSPISHSHTSFYDPGERGLQDQLLQAEQGLCENLVYHLVV